ncbi:MAG: class I SAM-dependent RNA methyltransferase [Shimia sp.]
MKVTIERLGARGDGVAPGPIYAERTLPGEVVSGTLDGAHLRDVRIETPSAHRAAPGCASYTICGGCAVLHAADAVVSPWKVGMVQAALAHVGLEAPFRPISTSPEASRRRAKLTGRRTKAAAIVGFLGRGTHTIASARPCRVLTPGLVGLAPALEALTVAVGSRKGSVAFHLAELETGIDVAVQGAKPLTLDLRETLARWAQSSGVSRLTVDGEGIAQAAPPRLTLGSAPVTPPPGAFLQATAHGQAVLTAAVEEAAGPAKRIADLFGGLGTFGLPLARRAEVTLYEGDPALTEAAQAGWRHGSGLHRFEALHRDLFRNPLDPAELARFEAVVIDPPRAGAEAQTRQLAAGEVPRIAAVSCNPKTFARDAALLATGGYRLDWVQVVDQFRWSPHVELAAQFTKG